MDRAVVVIVLEFFSDDPSLNTDEVGISWVISWCGHIFLNDLIHLCLHSK